MRAVRSVVALMATLAVIACQSLAGGATAAIPAAQAYSSAVAPATQPLVSSDPAAQARAKSIATLDEPGSRRKTILIVAILAAIVVAGVLLIGGASDGSSY